MISFACDYLEGCHEDILKALAATNRLQESGYGTDWFTASAIEKIREACACSEADIYFINGGTQTNQLVIDTMLQPYEGVVAAETGHVSVHEAGAIEFSGHKVLTVSSHCGKVKAAEVEAYVKRFYEDGSHEHMVFPGMLYISHPTEYGTLYTAKELRELRAVCDTYGMPLFVDGARLGYGLQARGTDVTMPLLAELSDVFYIGGTKVGALCGEAVVFTKQNTPRHFVTQIKQHGALSAKGRLMGIQFDTLFTDGLYEKISRHAIDMAEQVKAVFQEAGYALAIDSPTNQQFVILENNKMKELEKYVGFECWEPYDEQHTVVRFATSWATEQEHVDELRALLSGCKSME
ncbi:MAG: beta-eliminating lyase-related protein [Eubacteriales bacterium]|nr:beta-eliminating lyase-related protein [Eubacteriales bacterium]